MKAKARFNSGLSGAAFLCRIAPALGTGGVSAATRRALQCRDLRLSLTALLPLLVTVAGLAVILVPDRASAAAGDLYEAEGAGGEIFKFTPDGTKTTFASGLNDPRGLAFDSSGNLFEADENSNTIFKFTPDGTRSTFASGLNGPWGLAFDSSGNLFEADHNSGTIFKFKPDGTKSTFASGLSSPTGLAFDSSGNLFEADQGSGTIFKFAPDGTRSTFASGLNFPQGLAFDSSGNLFETEFSSSGAIFKFTPAGTKSTFASGLSFPTALAFDSSGNLFEADSGNNTIFTFTPAGVKSTFASGVGAPTGLAFQKSTAYLTNISTRAIVQTGNQVLIGGFIISGTGPKKVLLRGLGPTLVQFGIQGTLSDPTLTLIQNSTALATNDNWKNTQAAEIQASGKAPPDDSESAIIRTLAPGSYTAVMVGKNNTTGVGLVEVYDLDPNSNSTLTNISTRGVVKTGNNVMIGGFIVANGNVNVLVRALGPTLTQFGINNALADPTLLLVNANGQAVAFNDNWKNTQQAQIQPTGLAPPNDLEPGILVTLPTGNYTAVIAGKNGGTGDGLVEAYKLP
jgi:sugar lactone lactonase YvrE